MRIHWTVLFLVILVAACNSMGPATKPKPSAASSTALVYPTANKTDQVDTYHGVKVADPYRWLENIDSAETKAWIEAENHLTSGYLDTIPGRDAIRKRLTELWNYERISAPQHYGSRYFFSKNDGLQNQAELYVSEGLTAQPRLLLDPNTLSNDGTVALKDTAISTDGKYMAYGLSSAGSDWEEWRVLDVDSGKSLDDHLRWVKFSNVSWRRNGSGFYYSRYDEPKDENALKAVNQFQKLYFHRLGTKQSEDQLIYQRKDQPEWGFSGDVSDDGRYLIVSVSRGTERKNLVLVQDLGKKNAPVQTLIGEWNASYQFLGNDRTKFYFLTDADAPRYRIVAIDIHKPEKDNWHEVVAQDQATLQYARMVNRSLVAEYLKDAHSEVHRFDLKGKSLGSVDLPGIGTATGFTGHTYDTEMFYTYTSYTSPARIYRFDLKTGKNTLYRSPKLIFDPEQFETQQVFYVSRDGTRVPMFIIARKGLQRNGDNPVILFGYGGFNIPMVPAYSPAMMAWLDMGGVYAIANLRGGGEYGRDWHEAGIKTHKQNVFDDFIAAAEYLISEKYTTPKKLAIRGGSNGGLLVAAAALQRPELFAAAIPAVGVLDMLRFRDFTIGKAWESDYGSVENEAEFKALYAYSPLHNIKSNAHYPATLVLTGDHDDRVFPAHSFKFAAALQAANPHGNPALIRIETRAGHGQGKPTAKQIEETADVYAFIRKSFGLGQ